MKAAGSGGPLAWAGVLCAATLMVAGLVQSGGSAAHAQGGLSADSFQLTWQAGFDQDANAPIAQSSPIVATLDGGGPAAVVGDRTGWLYAVHLSDGSPVKGWPVHVGQPIDSTPSVLPTPSGLDDVFVGTGNAYNNPKVGGYRAYGPDGKLLWSSSVTLPAGDPDPAYGVQASLTVASLQGRHAVFAGSIAPEAYALDAAQGKALPGWPFFTADSTFSTAAATDLYGTGSEELVVGGASTAGFALGQQYPQGGHLRILDDHGGLICHYDFNQQVDSSPAVGPVLSGGRTGIVLGTGSWWPGASDTDTVNGFDTRCGRVWTTRLDGWTGSSPALARVLGQSSFQVVEGTANGSNGSVWVLDAATGRVIYHKPVSGAVFGSVVTADLTGEGYQDLLVPTIHGLDVLDGRTGDQIAVLSQGGYQNAPLVTRDPNGTIGITIAGYNGQAVGVMFHYEIAGSDGAEAVGPGSWPMFHHDPQLTGAVSRSPSVGTASCTIPAAAFDGYNLVGTDGGIFSYRQPFCGSTGGIRLAKPIVAAAMAPNTGGYWFAGSDGGVFTYGGARFFGSMGGIRLAQPVVGMAAMPDGSGYWLVAADGGVFAFGHAHFYGSPGGLHLTAPVVGMAATPDGRGYWLVQADGAVFTYGDAGFFGSARGVHLAHPIVAIAADNATGGYWLIASDGGVFSYNAHFYGSTGGIRLARPVVGVRPTEDGYGYWLVASDGGIFSFGDAIFYGSTGGIRLNKPIVSAVGFEG